MIIQGSNEPITLIFTDMENLPGNDMSISLRNETEEIKHWGMADLDIADGTYAAPITQEESKDWPEGPCKIEIKWLDSVGNTVFLRLREEIMSWDDKRILEEPV